VRGNPNARVSLVVFDDLECPFCAQLHTTLFPATLKHYEGLIKVIYKDDPLIDAHPWALRAAVDANCLAAQSAEAYWAYVDHVHSNLQVLTDRGKTLKNTFATLDAATIDEGLRRHVKRDQLDACIKRQDDSAVRSSIAEANALEIEGTPAIIIDGEMISGAQPRSQVWAAIDRALRDKKGSFTQ
jgi:protein-disulfide isomerase